MRVIFVQFHFTDFTVKTFLKVVKFFMKYFKIDFIKCLRKEDCSLIFSYTPLAIDNDIFKRVRKVMQGITINDENLAGTRATPSADVEICFILSL